MTAGKLTAAELRAKVEELVGAIPTKPNRLRDGPLIAQRLYRGKVQVCVGYYWHRRGSHHLSGIVYETVLGWGETPEDAIKMLTASVNRLNSP